MRGYTYLHTAVGHVTMKFGELQAGVDFIEDFISESHEIKRVGEFTFKDEKGSVKCDIVTVNGETHQESGTLYHITRETTGDYAPKDSGKLATLHQDLIKKNSTIMQGFGLAYAKIFGTKEDLSVKLPSTWKLA